MSDTELENALENVYASLKNDNEGIDECILALKIILYARKAPSVEVDPAKLAQSNRQGRKMMQSYFNKRGVNVTFADTPLAKEA